MPTLISRNDGSRAHRCECRNGFSGSYCQDRPDACSSNPCYNGASCNNFGTTYSCSCPQGFQGSQCEFNVNDCATNPCRNGGTCNDLVRKSSTSLKFTWLLVCSLCSFSSGLQLDFLVKLV